MVHQPQIGFRAFETEAYIGAVERFVFHIGFGAPAPAESGVEVAEVGGGVADFGEGEDVGGLAFVEIADFFDQVRHHAEPAFGAQVDVQFAGAEFAVVAQGVFDLEAGARVYGGFEAFGVVDHAVVVVVEFVEGVVGDVVKAGHVSGSFFGNGAKAA